MILDEFATELKILSWNDLSFVVSSSQPSPSGLFFLFNKKIWGSYQIFGYLGGIQKIRQWAECVSEPFNLDLPLLGLPTLLGVLTAQTSNFPLVLLAPKLFNPCSWTSLVLASSYDPNYVAATSVVWLGVLRYFPSSYISKPQGVFVFYEYVTMLSFDM